MVAVRKRNLKMFTLALLFIITITSFLLNYTHNTVMVTWDPKQIVFQVSEQFKKFIKYSRRPCNCNTCVSEPEVSLWFDERFNKTMQPFLTMQNYLVPDESLKWWLFLLGPQFQYKISIFLVELVAAGGRGWRNQPSPASAPSQMNRAPTAGFEMDVGSKTTHHFVYPESYRELAENVSMIVIPFKILDLRWIISALSTVFSSFNSTYVPVPRKIKVNKDKILVYNPVFIKYVYDNWLQHHGRYPSTGILSVIFALHICDEVDLYGFGADSKGNWHHYWENNPSAGAFRHTGVHDGDFESNVTGTLASVDKIRFFKGR
uniref:CMP-N-acetylneuraminate-beta-galactosamide-alpha-2,3-sialyltransferase 1 n=1 Tax=Sphenodon punctatus TaxID=8508 RepID=A0A8D0GTY7_SPHPU